MAKFEKISMTRKDIFKLMGDPNDKINPLRVGKLDRKNTATECFINFIDACNKVHYNNYENFDSILSTGVGLKPVQKSGLYDLWFYPKYPKYAYCVDIYDDTFVCRLDLNLKN